MICQTSTQLSSEGVEEKPELQPSPKPQEETVVSEAVLKRRAYHREWEKNHKERTQLYHQRKYPKIKERLRLKRATPRYKAKMKAYLKSYRAKRGDELKALNKEWNSKNKDWLTEYRQAYGPRRREKYQERREEICARKRELSKTPKYRFRIQDYQRTRRKNDPYFALVGSLRASMNRAFRRKWLEKPARTEELMGCTIEQAKAHIESQFAPGMSWEKRSSFVVDHIVPIEKWNLEDAEEVMLAFNWKNLQPLTWLQNAIKGDTLPNPLPSWIPAHIAARIEKRRP